MRIGIIDLGTNSIRLDIQQITPPKETKLLFREKLMVRLGQGLFLYGRLDTAAKTRTLDSLRSFGKRVKLLQVDRTVAFATSALREAADSELFLKQIKRETGIEIHVISGEEEARLIALGILRNEPRVKKGTVALVDIGGGSTEISIISGKKTRCANSFDLGSARLQQIFLKGTPPKKPKKGENDPIDQLREHVRSVIVPVAKRQKWPRAKEIFGSSGTARALWKITRRFEKKKSKKGMSLAALSDAVEAMSGMNTSQLLTMDGMEANRIDMILAGSILFEEIMRILKVKTAIPTDFSLRDGMLEITIDDAKKKSLSPSTFHIEDFINRAKKLGAEEAHFNNVRELSEKLFDSLKPLHKLKPFWKTYLSAAAILHDCGKSVNLIQHEQHSYYIARNMDFTYLQNWEKRLIANLCRFHNRQKLDPKKLPFPNHRRRREVFLRLLAILQVADAMDRTRRSNVRIRSVRFNKKVVTIRIHARGSANVEVLRAQQKKDLFENQFNRELVIVSRGLAQTKKKSP